MFYLKHIIVYFECTFSTLPFLFFAKFIYECGLYLPQSLQRYG